MPNDVLIHPQTVEATNLIPCFITPNRPDCVRYQAPPKATGMKYAFYLWCLLRRETIDVARCVWFVYHVRQTTDWFKRFLGDNIFKPNPIKLLMLAPIFDFLNDEGVAFVLGVMQSNRPWDQAMKELGKFNSDFTQTIGKPYLYGDGVDAYIYAEDFSNLRTLYLRNLLPLLTLTPGQEEEDEIWTQLQSFQLTPELST